MQPTKRIWVKLASALKREVEPGSPETHQRNDTRAHFD
jgi:hypothetical protein